jgi:hypothetical protein
MDHNISGRYRKFQANNLSDIDFLAEHGGNSGFAYIDRVCAHYRGVAWVDADVDVQLVARMTASFDHN